jgi:ribosome-associated heat shock protein Hsp15
VESVRIDRWLLAARCWKTRGQCQSACEGGHVRLNGVAAAPGKAVKVGDTVEAAGRVLVVTALDVRRGPAATARLLYEDRTPPEPPRDPTVAPRDAGAGRPTKRDRRLTERWRGY